LNCGLKLLVCNEGVGNEVVSVFSVFGLALGSENGNRAVLFVTHDAKSGFSRG